MEIRISSKIHEEAIVTSTELKLTLENPQHSISEALVDEMTKTVAWADANDIIIGHVKAYISCSGETQTLSTTGGTVNTNGTIGISEYPADTEIGIVQIVFGCEQKDADLRLESFVSAILSRFLLIPHFTYECDCGDDCEHDHHHHDHHHHDHHHHNGHSRHDNGHDH